MMKKKQFLIPHPKPKYSYDDALAPFSQIFAVCTVSCTTLPPLQLQGWLGVVAVGKRVSKRAENACRSVKKVSLFSVLLTAIICTISFD